MAISTWDERYRSGEFCSGNAQSSPTPLLVNTAQQLPARRALDLACGIGRNALWLAEHGWRVTAVDGASAAIEVLRSRAAERSLSIDATVTDIERGEFRIQPANWDLITICYYLQRDLFHQAKEGLVPGGVLLAIVHITEQGEEPTAHRLPPGELARHFDGWEILHSYEGAPRDGAHKRLVAEIVARRPSE